MKENLAKQKELNIPEFISLVASQIREAIQNVKDSDDETLLLLKGIQLQVAFTAEQSVGIDGKFELKPYVVAGGGLGGEHNRSQQIVHMVTLDLDAVMVSKPSPPFYGSELTKDQFPLLLEVCRELRGPIQSQYIFTGSDTELLPTFTVHWRSQKFNIEIRRRLAKELVQHIESLESLNDVETLYQKALDDLTFIPSKPYTPTASFPPVGTQGISELR